MTSSSQEEDPSPAAASPAPILRLETTSSSSYYPSMAIPPSSGIFRIIEVPIHKRKVATLPGAAGSGGGSTITYDRKGTRDILQLYPSYPDKMCQLASMDFADPTLRASFANGDFPDTDLLLLLRAEIHTKLSHYAQQDVRWAARLSGVTAPQRMTWETFWTTCFQPDCHYCRRPVRLLYEQRFDPRQWTFDRRNNNLFHTPDNVVVACLECNLKRRDKAHFRPNVQIVLT